MRNCAVNNSEMVQFAFDNRRKNEHNATRFYETLVQDSEWSQYISPKLTFLSSAESSRIRVADLFARETMKAWDNRFGPLPRKVRQSWTASRNTGRLHIEAVGIDWFTPLKENMTRFEKETGMSQSSYQGWLSDIRLQHSVSNLLFYAGFVGVNPFRRLKKGLKKGMLDQPAMLTRDHDGWLIYLRYCRE